MVGNDELFAFGVCSSFQESKQFSPIFASPNQKEKATLHGAETAPSFKFDRTG